MSGINPTQFKTEIVKNALDFIGLGGEAAINIVTGIALAESGLIYLRQINGPALGVTQMEPATHDDCWINFLNYKPDLRKKIITLIPCAPEVQMLKYNLYYSVIMARVKLLRTPEKLPLPNAATAMAAYWKNNYNTSLGCGNWLDNVPFFQRAIEA